MWLCIKLITIYAILSLQYKFSGKIIKMTKLENKNLPYGKKREKQKKQGNLRKPIKMHTMKVKLYIHFKFGSK